MIKYVGDNIFNINAEALVNPVNCVGVMGKGLALKFKEKYLDNFTYYKHQCDYEEVDIGKCLVYETQINYNPKYIINFPTKYHWKEYSKYKYIKEGLKNLVEIIKVNNIKSIAIPALGCGLGGLQWSAVHSLMGDYLTPLEDVEIIIIPPKGASV